MACFACSCEFEKKTHGYKRKSKNEVVQNVSLCTMAYLIWVVCDPPQVNHVRVCMGMRTSDFHNGCAQEKC
jgi:hypothetical protein